MSKSVNVWGSVCLCVFLSVCSEDYWHEAQSLPDILTFDASSRTIRAWTTKTKRRQKINLSAFTPRFFHVLSNLFHYFWLKGTIVLTLGLDAGWRRDAGL